MQQWICKLSSLSDPIDIVELKIHHVYLSIMLLIMEKGKKVVAPFSAEPPTDRLIPISSYVVRI